MSDILARLEAAIAERRHGDPESSHTARLFVRGRGKIAEKFGEEAVETIVAALSDDDAALTAEAADTLFHLLIVLAERGVPFAAVLAELERREGVSGIDEKAARQS